MKQKCPRFEDLPPIIQTFEDIHKFCKWYEGFKEEHKYILPKNNLILIPEHGPRIRIK